MDDQTKKDTPEGEIIYGRNAVTEALKADISINKVLVCPGDSNGRLKAIEALSREKKIIVQCQLRIVLYLKRIVMLFQGVFI